MLLKNHLDMIGRNEPITRKARFWQSYVRALKGTDDMRAPDRVSRSPRGIFRPLLSDFPEIGSSWPYNKSIYDDPLAASERITVPGYRYLPVSREIYGYSPRNLYPLPHLDRYYRPASWDPIQAWKDHANRLNALEDMYPKRRLPSPSPRRTVSPTPIRELSKAPSEPPMGYSYTGQPIYKRAGSHIRPLSELLEPLKSLPVSAIVRDPWWWDYPSLKPYTPYRSPYSPYSYMYPRTPFYLRDSYLSPVKRTYLWDRHPIRPFGLNWP